MNLHDHYPDSYLRDILRSVRTIAMVGASTNWKRPSFFVMKYLQRKGFRVIPVNPVSAGELLLGETVQSNLESIPEAVDMVDLFRKAEQAPGLAQAAEQIGAKVLWMQIGVRNDEAARLAENAGMQVVMDRCPKIEYSRLFGELGWHGVNTGVLTSKRRRY
ncbi:MAG: CoA-binding protein [SAR324 cluster bacterium]|nr:CoA-binding protein [SAR324 cluster bacterium]